MNWPVLKSKNKNIIIVLASIGLIQTNVCKSEGFEFEENAPKFKVTMPNLPQMKMEVHPLHVSQPYLRYMGQVSPYTVSIMTPTADKGMAPLDCASSIISKLTERPGVPKQESIYKAKIDETTFIALYAIPNEGFVQFNSHVLSATNDGHCIEVHASMLSTSKEDIDPWFGGFSKAHIQVN